MLITKTISQLKTFLLSRKLVVQSVFYKCSIEAPNKALILVCQRALLFAWRWIFPRPKCHLFAFHSYKVPLAVYINILSFKSQ